MTFVNKFLLPFLTAIILTILFSCRQGNSIKNGTQTDSLTTQKHALTIDTFLTIPPEIDGCSCYFSNNPKGFQKDEYIYVNDSAQTSFLKINGVVTKFTQTDFKTVDKTTTIAKAKSDKYEITITVSNGIQNGDEMWLKTGTIKLTDKNGRIVTKKFYGECGC